VKTRRPCLALPSLKANAANVANGATKGLTAAPKAEKANVARSQKETTVDLIMDPEAASSLANAITVTKQVTERSTDLKERKTKERKPTQQKEAEKKQMSSSLRWTRIHTRKTTK
jgi:hypothetical protein